MNKEKEINRLGKVITNSDYFGENNDELMLAQDILDAGYGNVKQAVKEAINLAKCYLHNNHNLDSELVKISIDKELNELMVDLYGVKL